MGANMQEKKTPMPSQDPNIRNRNFEEVSLGYTEEMAINEAKRCLQCKNRSDVVIDNFATCRVWHSEVWLLSVACNEYDDTEVF